MRLIMLAIATAKALVLTSSFSWADNASQVSLLDGAVATVHRMRSERTFGPSRDLLGRARAVLIVPNLVKGGFVFGGEGGDLSVLDQDVVER